MYGWFRVAVRTVLFPGISLAWYLTLGRAQALASPFSSSTCKSLSIWFPSCSPTSAVSAVPICSVIVLSVYVVCHVVIAASVQCCFLVFLTSSGARPHEVRQFGALLWSTTWNRLFSSSWVCFGALQFQKRLKMSSRSAQHVVWSSMIPALYSEYLPKVRQT